MMSSRRYAQSRLQNLLAFSLDFNIEDSRFEIAIDDISDMDLHLHHVINLSTESYGCSGIRERSRNHKEMLPSAKLHQQTNMISMMNFCHSHHRFVKE